MKAILIFALLLISLCCGWEVIRASIDTSGNRKFMAGEEMNIKISLTNGGNRTVYLLDWDTPFTSHGKFLRILYKDTSNAVSYRGIISKRGDPTLESYVPLNPDETVTVTVNVMELYPIYTSGIYEMQVMFKFRDYSFDPKLIPKTRDHFTPSDRVFSPAVDIEMIGDHVPHINDSHSMKRATGRFSHKGCTALQLSKVNNAWSTFERMIYNAEYEINRGNTQQYRTWFGSYLISRHTRVKGVMQRLKNFLAYHPTFDCAPTRCGSDSVFAYVFQQDPKLVVHLCKIFWTAPIGGLSKFDTQAGTIIHELSHFDLLGKPGNDDLAYGQTNLRNLAMTKPDDTVYNADSYEYFSEFTFV